MLLQRFIRLKIWNSTNTDVEYDNGDDTLTQPDWGISASSVDLNRMISDSDITAGEIFSSKLEVQVYGLDVDLTDRKIQLIAEDIIRDGNSLVTENNDPIVTEDGTHIQAGYTDTNVTTYLFTGYIESANTDYERTYRDIVAYDWFYFHQNDVLSRGHWESWWNSGAYPSGRGIYALTQNLLTILRNLYSLPSGTLFPQTDSLLDETELFKKPTYGVDYTKLTIHNLFKWIFEVNLAIPYIDGEGLLKFKLIRPPVSANTKFIYQEDFEHDTSTIESYTTNTVDGLLIKCYASDGTEKIYGRPGAMTELNFQVTDNMYVISDNVLLNAQNSTLYDMILDSLWGDTTESDGYIADAFSWCTPCEINLVISDLTKFDLNDRLAIEMKNHENFYVAFAHEIELSGSLLVNETLRCKASGKNREVTI